MKSVVVFLLLAFYTITGVAQEEDKIIGIWWNDEITTKIQGEKKDGKYVGTIVYIVPEKYKNGEPPKDSENPDLKLRNRSIVGVQILNGFVYNAKKKEWQEGTIYDPKSGNTYDCYAWMESNDLLKLKGFIGGVRWLGRSSEWFRTTL